MKLLSYSVLKNIGYQGYALEQAPERVLQFGEGNFLRGFVDYFIDVMNEKANFNSKVVVAQPIAPGLADMINQQEGLYTLYLRGRENGKKINHKRIISSISRCINPYNHYPALLQCAANPDLRFIVSNTTEAGIVYDPESLQDQQPPESFPAKLTAFLLERYKLNLPGFIILSCELIDNNGQELKKCVDKYIKQWQLSDEFKKWVDQENVFCSTLVDRIVTGYPRSEITSLNEENGYIDNIIDTGEIFGFWVIEGPEFIKKELPYEAAGLPITVVNDHSPYKQRKVRILNGAHTSMIMAAYLSGQDIVRNCMEDDIIRGFMEKTIYEEIIPTLTLPEKELQSFAASVTERFANPYIDHSLLDISLNSTAKWKARVMPSLLAYYAKKKSLPACITFSFAAYIDFYSRGEKLQAGSLTGKRGDNKYEIKDDQWILDFYADHKDDSIDILVKAVINNEKMWGDSLKNLEGFEQAVVKDLQNIKDKGMYAALKGVLS